MFCLETIGTLEQSIIHSYHYGMQGISLGNLIIELMARYVENV
jgi:hypothetical protein